MRIKKDINLIGLVNSFNFNHVCRIDSVDLRAKYFHVKEIFVNFTISKDLQYKQRVARGNHNYHIINLSLSFHKYCSHMNILFYKIRGNFNYHLKISAFTVSMCLQDSCMQGWDLVCQRILNQPLSIWHGFLQPLFISRVKVGKSKDRHQ